MATLQSVGQLEFYRNKILAGTGARKTLVHICMTGCRAYGAASVKAAIEEAVKSQGLTKQVEVRATGCHGFCAKAPVMAIEPLGVQYQEICPEDTGEIVAETLKNNRLIDRLAYKDPASGQPVFYLDQIPFYKKQVKRVLGRCGRIDPTQIDHYLGSGGYQALAKILSKMSP